MDLTTEVCAEASHTRERLPIDQAHADRDRLRGGFGPTVTAEVALSGMAQRSEGRSRYADHRATLSSRECTSVASAFRGSTSPSNVHWTMFYMTTTVSRSATTRASVWRNTLYGRMRAGARSSTNNANMRSVRSPITSTKRSGASIGSTYGCLFRSSAKRPVCGRSSIPIVSSRRLRLHPDLVRNLAQDVGPAHVHQLNVFPPAIW